jgi:flagellar hook-length control protein FliK
MGVARQTADTRRIDASTLQSPTPVRLEHSDQQTQQIGLPVPEANTEKPVVTLDATTQTNIILAGSGAAQSIGSVARPITEQTSGQTPPSASIDRVTPANQVESAIVGLLKTSDGVQSVTIRMQPPELGQVAIRVDRTSEGVAHVDITTERPETLQLLQRDQQRLEQSLDQAGVLSAGRSVSFQVSPTEQINANASRPDNMATGSNDPGHGQNGGAWRHGEDARRDPGAGQGSHQNQARGRWFRAGLDITA